MTKKHIASMHTRSLSDFHFLFATGILGLSGLVWALFSVSFTTAKSFVSYVKHTRKKSISLEHREVKFVSLIAQIPQKGS